MYNIGRISIRIGAGKSFKKLRDIIIFENSNPLRHVHLNLGSASLQGKTPCKLLSRIYRIILSEIYPNILFLRVS
jgi:hypothetical protein